MSIISTVFCKFFSNALIIQTGPILKRISLSQCNIINYTCCFTFTSIQKNARTFILPKNLNFTPSINRKIYPNFNSKSHQVLIIQSHLHSFLIFACFFSYPSYLLKVHPSLVVLVTIAHVNRVSNSNS